MTPDALRVTCPRCKAGPGERCRSLKAGQAHAARRERAEALTSWTSPGPCMARRKWVHRRRWREWA